MHTESAVPWERTLASYSLGLEVHSFKNTHGHPWCPGFGQSGCANGPPGDEARGCAGSQCAQGTWPASKATVAKWTPRPHSPAPQEVLAHLPLTTCEAGTQMVVRVGGTDDERGGSQHIGTCCLPPPSCPGARGLMGDEGQPGPEPASLLGHTLH